MKLILSFFDSAVKVFKQRKYDLDFIFQRKEKYLNSLQGEVFHVNGKFSFSLKTP